MSNYELPRLVIGDRPTVLPEKRLTPRRGAHWLLPVGLSLLVAACVLVSWVA